jgi:hypothetical protein
MMIRSTRATQQARRLHALIRVVGLMAAIVLGGVCSGAQAQGARNVAGAADAFSKAQQAELRGDFQEAAGLYALADEMAPAAEALRSAARTAQKAGMNATAATHAAALLARESDAASRSLAEEILSATAGELGRLHVICSMQGPVHVRSRLRSSRATRPPKRLSWRVAAVQSCASARRWWRPWWRSRVSLLRCRRSPRARSCRPGTSAPQARSRW